MAKQYGFYIDIDRCAQCNACEVACKATNHVELGVQWIKVISVWNGQYPNLKLKNMPVMCRHCAEPSCIKACPEGAISKRAEDGIVIVDQSKCVSHCHKCEDACSYGAPQFGKDDLMQKCNLCIDRVSVGMQPACIWTCPAESIKFGELDDLPKFAGGKTGKMMEGDTHPSVFVVGALK